LDPQNGIANPKMIGTNIEAHIGTLAMRRIGAGRGNQLLCQQSMRGGEMAYVSGDVAKQYRDDFGIVGRRSSIVENVWSAARVQEEFD